MQPNGIDAFQWLMKWYQERCNDLWEHQYGVKIDTIDNPGWDVKIDLAETPLENVQILYHSEPWEDDNDWYGHQIKDGIFNGYGDPMKLGILITSFKNVWESHNKPIP